MRKALSSLLAAVLALLSPVSLAAQSAPPSAVEVGLLLRQLDGVKRVLLVAAHPDDEDTSLLATLALGWGVEIAYFSLTRGEGGQNLIGAELEEGLGILRTGELLAARQIDGASQFFSRAYDFGYSKSAAETFEHWPREQLLADLVRAVRSFRPQVLISIFSGTETDGHGQHQAAGILAREAWEASGDRSRFPEQLEEGLEPWTPLKLYRRTLFDPQAATVSVVTGRLDPLLGRSHHQVAMESRSQHRSQDFGTAQAPGPREARLRLLDTRVAAPPDAALFAGVDTTLAGLPGAAIPEVGAALGRYRGALGRAAADLPVGDPSRALGALAEARGHLGHLLSIIARSPAPELRRALEDRRVLLDRALLAAAGVRIELRARDDVLVPGQRVLVEVRVWSGGSTPVRVAAPELIAPGGWRVAPLPRDAEVPPDDTGPFARFFASEDPLVEPDSEGWAEVEAGDIALWRYEVAVAEDAPPSTPYYLTLPRDGDLYQWPGDAPRGLPFQGPVLEAALSISLPARPDPVIARLRAPVRFRGVDKASGEFWRPLRVAPRVSVAPSTGSLVWPLSDQGEREVAFQLTNWTPGPVRGALSLELPPGWRAEPVSRDFEFREERETTRLAFRLRPAGEAVEGDFVVRPRIDLGRGPAPGLAVRVVDYPHVEPRLAAAEGSLRIVRFPVQVAARRIGYVMGSGDEGPEAIRQLGLEVELIEPGAWGAERLDRFDTIVLGVRAYEVRRDLVAANPLLLDWVRRGGTLLVQYNKYEFNDGAYAPYPIRIGAPAPRVTDEDAPVTLRDEGRVAFETPNPIGAADFEGWIQERGLYFPTEWDARYSELLEMADPGEPPRRGSLLVTPFGEGLYVHTSLSFFRQLPSGVPGAVRLFANLLSLDGDRWRGARAVGVRP